MSTLTKHPNSPVLQGTWHAETASLNGKAVDPVIGQHLTFSGDHFRIDKAGNRLYGGQYNLSNSNDPHHIEFRQTETTQMAGTWRGIYDIVGDRLTICDNARDMTLPRPADFAQSETGDYILITYKRQAG